MNNLTQGLAAPPPGGAADRSIPAVPEAVRLGRRLQRLRTQGRVTLSELATRAGLSKGYLSRIEQGKQKPPLRTLARLAQTLGISLARLLKDAPANPLRRPAYKLNRQHEHKPEERVASGFGYRFLRLGDDAAGRRLQPRLVTIPAEADPHVFFEHEEEEFLLLLEGRLEWQGGHRKHVLHPGDAVHFDGRMPHRGRALDGPARALMITSRRAA
jgi:transcriptional regulator with XRE-family HTH domain